MAKGRFQGTAATSEWLPTSGGSLLGRAVQGMCARLTEDETEETCPAQQSFLTYLRNCAYTEDSAQGGVVRKWPWDDDPASGKTPDDTRSWDEYWRQWERVLLCCHPLLCEKVRRVMATNVCSHFALWIAAGGQHPWWPALMRTTKNRRILVQAVKAEGEGGSQEIVERVFRTLENCLEKGLIAHWPSFPTAHHGMERGIFFSNGSRIVPVSSGASQLRGPGTLLLWLEELSHWQNASESVSAAIPTLYPDGHLVANCTPKVDAFTRDIVEGRVKHVVLSDAKRGVQTARV